MKLLTRDEFREGVFKRDKNKCVICQNPALDAHHIIERRLFKDGGYYLDNGASLCEKHHIEAETTVLECNTIRYKCGIENIIIPEHFYSDIEYDKWGNILLPNGNRLKGELFYDESVQKILKQGNVLGLFQKYIKYPRTYHLPWSNLLKDDRILEDDENFKNKEVIVTLKMDGENCLESNTLIITEDGTKTIKEIVETKYPGRVFSKNLEDDEYELQNILNYFCINSKDTDEWFEIELENGKKLKVTGEHYIYLTNEFCYRKVKDLKGNEEIEFRDF